MKDNGYVKLDTRSFDRALEKKNRIVESYNNLNKEYDDCVKKLMENWKGSGAEAFQQDALTVKRNIVGIYDILTLMFDTLTDCREIFAECDKGLGDSNRNLAAENAEEQ